MTHTHTLMYTVQGVPLTHTLHLLMFFLTVPALPNEALRWLGEILPVRTSLGGAGACSSNPGDRKGERGGERREGRGERGKREEGRGKGEREGGGGRGDRREESGRGRGRRERGERGGGEGRHMQLTVSWPTCTFSWC